MRILDSIETTRAAQKFCADSNKVEKALYSYSDPARDNDDVDVVKGFVDTVIDIEGAKIPHFAIIHVERDDALDDLTEVAGHYVLTDVEIYPPLPYSVDNAKLILELAGVIKDSGTVVLSPISQGTE